MPAHEVHLSGGNASASVVKVGGTERKPWIEARPSTAAFVEGYGCDRSFRLALPDVMGDRAAAMHEALQRAHRLGHEPWATMYISGHGAHWDAAAAYVRRHRSLWTDALAPFAG